MIIQQDPPLHLTYCLNIHPGETWVETFNALRTHVPPIRDRLSPGSAFGLGLRLARRAVADLLASGRREAFKAYLQQEGLYAFSINGFPYGAFHRTRIKETVYQPDWRTDERLKYTVQLADLLADLLPEGVAGSISTVPGSFKTWIRSTEDIKVMVERLADTVVHLAALYEEYGKEIHLGLEPEPACFLETTAETIAFFNDHLLTDGVEHIVRRTGRTRAQAETAMRRHLGVCFDTCHLAIQFEDLAEALGRYEAEGVRISKIQLSAALRADNTPETLEALAPFDEPVYLHQVVTRSGKGGKRSWTDLGPALAALPQEPSGDPLRVHFHVPLFWQGNAPLFSTAPSLTPAFFSRLGKGASEHLEIETYTFDVLPAGVRPASVEESIAAEYRWVLDGLHI